ncbi:ubiquitin hydrolase [Reticulomyxa filosa]|uniref:Ubiquitin hydrolase n=1 Tax=Reticulomyxa filosa TaxID=46433 RepID=X6N6R9_RETFI|nr:ubiquitin hydrolase [Reticulomyxa filosa]|eukprot:ETO21429.1 ubiquitin hydrolase [Reticulomyxa filosa]
MTSSHEDDEKKIKEELQSLEFRNAKQQTGKQKTKSAPNEFQKRRHGSITESPFLAAYGTRKSKRIHSFSQFVDKHSDPKKKKKKKLNNSYQHNNNANANGNGNDDKDSTQKTFKKKEGGNTKSANANENKTGRFDEVGKTGSQSALASSSLSSLSSTNTNSYYSNPKPQSGVGYSNTNSSISIPEIIAFRHTQKLDFFFF